MASHELIKGLEVTGLGAGDQIGIWRVGGVVFVRHEDAADGGRRAQATLELWRRTVTRLWK